MTTHSPESLPSFEFVIQDPKERFSKETKTKIRKQAMRAVGARRRSDGPKSPSPTAVSRHRQRGDSDKIPSLVSMPLSPLELLVRNSGIDPIDLSALASVHIGAIASDIFSSQPTRLSRVLSCRQRSYFSFIPPRFGRAAVLDDAFRCLVTAVHSLLVPDHKSNPRVILCYYETALHSLRSAVNDSTSRYNSEVLCATAMLALFELLNSDNAQPWSQHIAGASRLIQLRGPSRFISEFDKTLFISLSYPICTEALLNNEKCFLDDPKWAEVFTSAIDPHETFTDRSQLGIELMMLKCTISGLAKRANHAIVIQNTLLPSDFEALAVDIRAARSKVIVWRRKFNTALIHAGHCSKENTADFGKRYEILGISLIINILVSRLLGAIVPNDRAFLEEEVQNVAIELKVLQDTSEHNPRASFFFAQKGVMADAAIATHACFSEVIHSGKVVDSWRLQKFFDVLGRKSCNGETCCDMNKL